MATRRVVRMRSIWVTCPHCRKQYGPYQQVQLGPRQCSSCGRGFNLTR